MLTTQVQAARRESRRWPGIRKIGVRNREPNAMARLEKPARGVEFDCQLDHLSGNKGRRIAVGVAMGGVEHTFGDQSRAAVGSNVAQPRGKSDHLSFAVDPKQETRPAEDLQR